MKIFILQISKRSLIDNSVFHNIRTEAGESKEALIEYIKSNYRIDILIKEKSDDFPYFTDGGFKYTGKSETWEYTFVCYPHSLLKTTSPVYREPLFVTEDGKDVFENDRVWYVNQIFIINFHDFVRDGFKYDELKHYPHFYKYFSTEDAAKDYVLMEKSMITVKEAKEWFAPYLPSDQRIQIFNGFKEYIKHKIKTNE